MSAVDDLFRNLRAENRKAFMPFVTAGDPDLDFTAAVLGELDRRGCALCELGIPYSDPIADGPVIQASYTRALDKGLTLAKILQMAGQVAPTISMPMVTMVSYAIIYRHGLEAYVAAAKSAGVAGAIVPDLLVDEADELAQICRREDFSLIQLATPTTPRERALRIAESSTGFLYYVSVTGITGERQELPPSLIDNVSWLREQTDLPICIGFGISRPEHAQLLAPVADGLIVGSAIVRRIAQASERPRAEVLEDVGEFAEQLVAACE
ncbi:MAG: tryptophan synthase subunit alpha [Pirellulaceae bacterium]|jgi:tryptophan synthase alpha chain|nr:tryptophan synthase subunit alpha [Pirellulaceae bacterium]MDP7014920.1 tryptophan synthase subunit alpha [Pirellulaceae bacterium]